MDKILCSLAVAIRYFEGGIRERGAALCYQVSILKMCKRQNSVKIKLPLPRKNLGVSQGQFDQLEEEEVEEMLELELWEKDKFAVWKEEKEAEKRIKMAQSGR